MKYLILLIFTALNINGNKKSDTNTFSTEGLTYYAGNPSMDGWGWLIKTDSAVYAPVDLEATFQLDSLSITFNFSKLNTNWICGWREPY